MSSEGSEKSNIQVIYLRQQRQLLLLLLLPLLLLLLLLVLLLLLLFPFARTPWPESNEDLLRRADQQLEVKRSLGFRSLGVRLGFGGVGFKGQGSDEETSFSFSLSLCPSVSLALSLSRA